jgi:DNA ligase (NAD+)
VNTNIDQVAARIAELRKEIEVHNYRYYVENNPVVADEEYDRMFRELRELEQEHPELASPDSPTQRVGAEPQERFQKVEHLQPMLSLANAFDEEELRTFERRIRNLLKTDEIDYVTELKIDGNAVALTYEDGLLVRGATRERPGRGRNYRELEDDPYRAAAPASGARCTQATGGAWRGLSAHLGIQSSQ